jgi:hypothetical protein
MVCRGGSISEMTEMEFYDGKKEDSQIHYIRRNGDACHGHLLVPEEEY